MNDTAQTERINAAIMNIRMELIRYDRNGEKKIELLDRLLRICAPVIVRSGGRLTRVGEEGTAAVFEKRAEDALHCAFEIFLRAADAFDDREQAGLTMGIHSGTVFLSSVRYQEFSAPLAVSEGLRTARMLSQTAAKYNARILATGTALGSIHSFENRFSTRKLGLFLHEPREELIFDVFDSDPTDVKYAKRRSRIAFETGVDLFLQGKYLQARSYFIELLKLDRNDVTAKRYVFMCDKALSGGAENRELKYLEIW